MLGWHISVYRIIDGRSSPAMADSPRGNRLAVWQTGVDGLQWIDELVKAGRAVELQAGGYPWLYTATAKDLIPGMGRAGNTVWIAGPHDILTDQWEGRTVIDDAEAEDCRPDERLIVEAWDES